jgi:hypothetical protein
MMVEEPPTLHSSATERDPAERIPSTSADPDTATVESMIAESEAI